MGFIKDTVNSFTGRSAAKAATNSANIQAASGQAAIDAQLQANREAIAASNAAANKGIGFLDQFSGITQRGIDESSFLANPEAQFEFLKNNPLFNLALENANRETSARAASKGRLSAGDTLEQLSNNVLLASQPLIDRQRNDIGNLLNIGQNISTSKANAAIGQGSNVSNILTNQGTNVSNALTSIGAAKAAGVVGAASARDQGTSNLIQLGGSLFSDSRLKENGEITGINENGYNLWKWSWNDTAKKLFNLDGDSYGVMFSDVLEKNPEAVEYQDGYGKVNYNMIGVRHGS